MRYAIIIMVLSIVGTAIADQYVYVRDGRVQSAPRELPAAAVRLDTGETILGMHARTDAVRAACGWYRVVPSAQTVAKGQVVTGRSYVLGKGTAQEVLTIAERKTRTPEQSIAAALAQVPGATDDERVTALVRAVATVVTGKLDKAVTITVPARSTVLEVR